MNSISRSPFCASAETSRTETSPEVNAYQWLLVLGFPAPVAAASTMPELFTNEESRRITR